jgi:hypothetical protein
MLHLSLLMFGSVMLRVKASFGCNRCAFVKLSKVQFDEDRESGKRVVHDYPSASSVFRASAGILGFTFTCLADITYQW